MKFNTLIITAALFGATCTGLLPIRATEAPVDTFESALRERFDDPASVEFTNVRQGTDGRSFCGEVNGRDRHGAMTGFRQFVVYGIHGSFMVLIAESDSKRDRLTCN